MSGGPNNWMTPPPFDRVAPAIVARARKTSAATMHEAGGKIGVMPSAIKPIHPGFRLCGPAVTVQNPGGDNLWIHHAIYAAEAGDILVVHCSGYVDHGYWGEVMSTAAAARNLGGLVIDGCVRDFDLLGEVGFPVFARGLCIRGTGKDRDAAGWINAPTRFDGLIVNPGDLILGDADGVVAVPAARADGVVTAALQRDVDEAAICERLRAGETSLNIYGFC